MKCPNCGVEGSPGATECAGCGVIFAKFKKKLACLDTPAPATFNPWKGRAIAVAIVVLWLLAFGLYYRRAVLRLRASQPMPNRPVR